ncbi:hypothetical protein A7K99_05630 [Tatumella citrea]|uniref:Uncharacterized protein n=1 Tax=Tatumella citrea TaxID=53336 RepID=A0A1Y0L5L2_TATCI|nr:hypothetical protein A7K98_05630 [Tatumella citrea]ARU97351.1 hypothetical protein A7K99_05630 [Tatumella citrea]
MAIRYENGEEYVGNTLISYTKKQNIQLNFFQTKNLSRMFILSMITEQCAMAGPAPGDNMVMLLSSPTT